MEKGREQGLEQSQKTLRDLLLRLLQGRLGSEPQTDLLAVIEGEKDLGLLSRWVEQVALAGSPEQARAAIVPKPE